MSKCNKNKLVSRVFSIMKNIEKTEKCLVDAKDGLIANDYDKFETKLEKSLINIEKSYLAVRRFAAESIGNYEISNNLNTTEIETAKIEIEEINNHIIKFTVPVILPFKRLKSCYYVSDNKGHYKTLEVLESTEAFSDLIKIASRDFIKKTNLDCKIYKRSVLVFVNSYDADFDRKRIPDTDNYSYKGITDAISSQFIGDDNFNQLSFMYTTQISDKTKTEIYLVPISSLSDAIILTNFGEEFSNNNIIKFPNNRVAA